MKNQGVRYFVEADCAEHIENFANEIVKFRATINRDIIAKFNDTYIHINDKMNTSDIIKEYYMLREE